jgi:hypothetical protein
MASTRWSQRSGANWTRQSFLPTATSHTTWAVVDVEACRD